MKKALIILAHTCELKYISGAKLKAFGLGYSFEFDVLKAGISGTKGANCVFTNILVLGKDPCICIEIQKNLV